MQTLDFSTEVGDDVELLAKFLFVGDEPNEFEKKTKLRWIAHLFEFCVTLSESVSLARDDRQDRRVCR